MNSVTIRNNNNNNIVNGNSIIINSVALTLSNSAMILFVVMAGQEYPDYGYPFAVVLAVFSVIVYIIMYAISCFYYNEQFSWNLVPNNQLTNKDIVSIISVGIFWGINYVFVLVSNPYVPGLIQIILNELNLIWIFLISKYWNEKEHNKFHCASVIIVIFGGIAHACGTAFLSNDDDTNSYSYLWQVAFLIGTVAIAFSNIITEGIVQKYRNMHITLFYFYINIICVIICGLMYFPIKKIISNTDETFITGANKIITLEGLGAWWTWCALILTVPSNILTARLSRFEDATFASVMLSVAPGISAAFMAIKPIFQKYYKQLIWTDIVSLVLVILGAILYKTPDLINYFHVNNDNDNIIEEPLVRRYSDTESYQNQDIYNSPDKEDSENAL